MTAFVVAHRDEFGLEPICRELQVAPSAVRSCLAVASQMVPYGPPAAP